MSAAAQWRCGHPKTPENTQSVGVENGVRCKICRRIIHDRSRERMRLQGAVDIELIQSALFIPHDGRAKG